MNRRPASGTKVTTPAIPDAVVAVYATEADLTTAIKYLEHERYDMASVSVLGTGVHRGHRLTGAEAQSTQAVQGATLGGLWGWLLGAFIFVPGVGHVAIGRYLLFTLISAGIGATGGALGGALTSTGIPKDGLPVPASDLPAARFVVIVHGTWGEVDRARAMLGKAHHDHLARHQATTGLLGSVSQHCVQHAPCPVAVIPQ